MRKTWEGRENINLAKTSFVKKFFPTITQSPGGSEKLMNKTKNKKPSIDRENKKIVGPKFIFC
jgi:hypothetical protein